MEDLRYPIGKFYFPDTYSKEEIKSWINDIENCAPKLKEAINGLSKDQLDTPYRPDGWTVSQVIHHLADSHLNSYIRFKWALTEDTPLIKAYDEAAWAELDDGKSNDLDISIRLLEALHQRWVIVLRNLSAKDLKKEFKHPELGNVVLASNIALYAWHSKHHIAHIKALRERNGW